MNETYLAIAVLCASVLLTLVDPSKSSVLEYVVISLVGYLCGRTQERVRACDVRGRQHDKSDSAKS